MSKLKLEGTYYIHQLNEKNKPFKCDNCDANFAFKNSVKRHIRSVHKETPLKFQICKEEFLVIRIPQ